VERCNECGETLLRFERKLSRFLSIEMKKHRCHIGQFRQNLAVRWTSILVLWIAVITSIPHVNVDSNSTAFDIQRILPPDPIPCASPGHLIKTIPEFAEYSSMVLNTADLEEHLLTYSTLELCSLEHAFILLSSLIYTQTTSSYL
jgi:hypothetical protein